METQRDQESELKFTAAELGALAHLYRGDLYQTNVWRSRLDATTNWAVVTTGITLSVTFSSAEASPVPILLASWIVAAFLFLEARRYQFYDIFRIRLKVLEINLYAPMLEGRGLRIDNRWNQALADSYRDWSFHIRFLEALGFRLRRHYAWLFIIHVACYARKIIVHPTPLESLSMLWPRVAMGPISGGLVLVLVALFHGAWIVIAVLTMWSQQAVAPPRKRNQEDPLLAVLKEKS
jgi:uncharacterized membrane protein